MPPEFRPAGKAVYRGHSTCLASAENKEYWSKSKQKSKHKKTKLWSTLPPYIPNPLSFTDFRSHYSMVGFFVIIDNVVLWLPSPNILMLPLISAVQVNTYPVIIPLTGLPYNAASLSFAYTLHTVRFFITQTRMLFSSLSSSCREWCRGAVHDLSVRSSKEPLGKREITLRSNSEMLVFSYKSYLT